MRRGITDFNGLGDTVGGIVVMRQGKMFQRLFLVLKINYLKFKSHFPRELR